MKANYKIEAGDVRVIRPLCYAREALMKDFAKANRLPVVNENCPACFEEPKERHRVKKVRRWVSLRCLAMSALREGTSMGFFALPRNVCLIREKSTRSDPALQSV